MLRTALMSACCLAMVLTVGCKKENAGGSGKLRIAVVPKGTSHVFWKSVEAGAKKAGQELGVEIIWKGPLKEDDRAEQIKVVQQFVSEGVDGIVLAPLDYKALTQPVAMATDKKIPVVIFDSALEGQAGKDFVSFVATDNRKGGEMAGRQLAKLLNNQGNVVLLRYAVGSASTDEREAGFLDVMKQHPGIKMIVDNQYGGATFSEAKNKALTLKDDLKKAQGIFCPNESSTLGMLSALQDEGLAGKVVFVGFDATPPLVDALRKGEIKALVAQNPTKMGYEGVKTLVAHIKGQKPEPRVDTGVELITVDRLEQPAIKELLGAE